MGTEIEVRDALMWCGQGTDSDSRPSCCDTL